MEATRPPPSAGDVVDRRYRGRVGSPEPALPKRPIRARSDQLGLADRSRLGWRPRAVVAVVLGVIVLPAVRGHDSFPLSTYPMYARSRDAIDERGGTRRLSTATIARTDDPLIASSLLRTAIRTGRADALCAEIATRAPAGTVAVEVVDERVDLVGAAAGDGSVRERTVRARCEVRP